MQARLRLTRNKCLGNSEASKIIWWAYILINNVYEAYMLKSVSKTFAIFYEAFLCFFFFFFAQKYAQGYPGGRH